MGLEITPNGEWSFDLEGVGDHQGYADFGVDTSADDVQIGFDMEPGADYPVEVDSDTDAAFHADVSTRPEGPGMYGIGKDK